MAVQIFLYLTIRLPFKEEFESHWQRWRPVYLHVSHDPWDSTGAQHSAPLYISKYHSPP